MAHISDIFPKMSMNFRDTGPRVPWEGTDSSGLFGPLQCDNEILTRTHNHETRRRMSPAMTFHSPLLNLHQTTAKLMGEARREIFPQKHAAWEIFWVPVTTKLKTPMLMKQPPASSIHESRRGNMELSYHNIRAF